MISSTTKTLHLAKAADQGKPIEEERIIGFEDPAEVLPGHGRMQEVRAAASRFQLMAEVTSSPQTIPR